MPLVVWIWIDVLAVCPHSYAVPWFIFTKFDMRIAVLAAAIGLCAASQISVNGDAAILENKLLQHIEANFQVFEVSFEAKCEIARRAVALYFTKPAMPLPDVSNKLPSVLCEAITVAAYDMYSSDFNGDRSDYFLILQIIGTYLDRDMIVLPSKFDGKKHAIH